jgi:hypothetical protein
MSEQKFKSWLRKHWDGWFESYEPRKGSGIGIADVQVVVDGRIVPLELKIGKFVNGLLCPEEVRPAQINWHRELNAAGIHSFFLVGVPDKKLWAIYIIRPNRIVKWSEGYECDPEDKLNAAETKHWISVLMKHGETKW